MEDLKTILIVDDIETNINLLMELLEDKYDILASMDGVSALEMVEEEKVDLILLDIMMPQMDGFEVCTRLKSNEKTKDIPIIFITAKTDEDSIEKAYEIGGMDYITKPFKAREVLSRINTQLFLAEQKAYLEQRIKEEVDKNLKKELQLFESAKLAAMGSMVGNIIHQWKQPLSIISVIASSLKVKIDLHNTIDIKEVEKASVEIEDLIQRLSEITQTFRDFLKEKKETKTIVLQDRLDNSLIISGTVLKDKGIKLIKQIDYEKKIKITTVPNELTEVIINIINNAIDILEEKKLKDGWVKVSLNIEDNNAIISIEDNGGGIPSEVMPHIFEEYFTTKEENKGTGLGLYMSHKIVSESLNGQLYVKNTEDGAKFFIKLPLS